MLRRLSLNFVLLASVSLTGCSTISDWFADEEELKVKELKPIDALFEPQVVWQESMGDGVGPYFSRLRPALGYDLLYAANRQGLVRAYEPATGKEVWEQNFASYRDEGYLSGVSRLWSDGESARLSGGLTLAYEKVFVGTENGDVLALDAKTGELAWRITLPGEVLAAPAVDSNVVVVNTGAGVMYGLDATDGKELWRYESEVPPLSLRGIAAPIVANGGAIVGTATGKVSVTIVSSGQLAWEQTIAAPSGATELERIADIDSKILVLGGLLYTISYDGTLAAIELRSGRVVWKREYKSYRRISMDGNSLFVTDTNSVVYALDRRNGVELWSQGALRYRNLTAATPVSSYVVMGDKYGYLHWLNQSTGEIVARLEVGGDDEDESIYAAPVVEGRTVYTQTRDGDLVAIETP